MILFRKLHIVLIILGLSVNFGYGQDEPDPDVGAPLGEEDVGGAKGLILIKGLKGLAKLKLFKGLLKDKLKLGLAKGFLLGKIVGAPNPFGGGETPDETADYFFQEAPEDVQASLWGGQQFDPNFHPERSPYHMNDHYNYNVHQNAYNRDHEPNLGAPYQYQQYQYNNIDENMYRTMEEPMNNYPQYHGYQPNYDPYEYEGMQASNLEPVKVRGPNDDLYAEMDNTARNYFQPTSSQFEAKSRIVRQGPVGPDPRATYRTPDFMLQRPNPTQPNLQPNNQPIMWYSFNEGSKPYAIDFNYETAQYRNPIEHHQTPITTYESTTSDDDEVGAANPIHDHMSHIPEEDKNVNPIIMQEYVSSVHGYNYDQQQNNYSNQKKRTNDLEKKKSSDVNSKDMEHEETEEISNENSLSSSVELSTSSNSEKIPYEIKTEPKNILAMTDTIIQQSPHMKNPRLEKRQETKRFDDASKMKSEQPENQMNSFIDQQTIHQTPQNSDRPHDFKAMQTLPGNQQEILDIAKKTSYQAEKPGAPEIREVFFNGEKALEYRFTSPEEAVVPEDSQLYYNPNPARSMYQQYTPSVSQDQHGEIIINEQQDGRAIVVPAGPMPVTTPTEATRMMQPEFVDPTSPYGMQYQYQPEPQPQFRYTEDDPSAMVYGYDSMQYRMPMNGEEPQFLDAQQPLEEMTPQMPEHERTFHKGNLFGVSKYNSGYGGFTGKLANKKGKGDKYSQHGYSSYDSHQYGGGYSHGGGHGYGGYSHGGGHSGYSHGGGHSGYSHGGGHGGYSHGSGYGHGGYSHGSGYGHGHGYVSQPNPTEFPVGPEAYTTHMMKRSATSNTDLVASETTNEHPVVKRQQDCTCPQTWGPPQDYVAGPYQGQYQGRNPEDVGSPFTQILGKPYLGFWGPAGFVGQWLFRPASGRPFYGSEDHDRYERAIPNFLKKDNDQKLVPGMRFKKQLYKGFKTGPLGARFINVPRENDIKSEKDTVNTEK